MNSVTFIPGPDSIVIELNTQVSRSVAEPFLGGQFVAMVTEKVEIRNDELAKLVNHLSGLVRNPAKATKASGTTNHTSEHFDAFKALYPKKRWAATAQVLEKWKKRNLDALWPVIERHLNQEMPRWAVDGNEPYQYCPLVLTYINQSRWEQIADEPQMKII